MARLWKKETAQNLRERWKQSSDKIRDTVPPGGRAPLGLLMIVGGIFGILPILGFWMIPLGIAVVAMDVAPLVRAVTGRRERPSSNPGSDHAPTAPQPDNSDPGARDQDDSLSK